MRQIIRLEVTRDTSQDCVWDQPYAQHENLARDAAWLVILLVGILATAAAT